jgi:peroxiredoxin
MAAEIGAPAPDFTLLDQERNPVSLDDLKGQKALVAFIPFPFTGICTDEACTLQMNLGKLADLDARAVIITAHALPTNKRWAEENDLSLPVLSDFWPHGKVATDFGTFDENLGVATRTTYVLDADGVVRDIIATESLGVAREYDAYVEALEAI